MSGFLHRLAARSLGLAPGLMPRRASLFEGAAPLAEPAMEAFAPTSTPTQPSIFSATEPAFAHARPQASGLAAPAAAPSRISTQVPAPLPASSADRVEVHELREILREAPLRMEEAPVPRALSVLRESVFEHHMREAHTHTERLTHETHLPSLLPPPAAPKAMPLASPLAAKAATPRPVQVTIGRVEIRAAASPERRPKAAEPEPGRNLEDYLRSRRGR